MSRKRRAGRRDAAPVAPTTTTRLDSLVNEITGLGGWADKGAASRPNPFVMPLTGTEAELLYANNGTARRLIDILPQRACRRGWSVPEIDETEERRLRTWSRVEQAAIWARLYGGAGLLIVTEEDLRRSERREMPRDRLAKPLDPTRLVQIVTTHALDGVELQPVKWENDPRSPRWRLPSAYNVSVDDFNAEVHWSRILHFRGSRRPPSQYRRNIWPDATVLQVFWDELRRLTDTLAGGAVLASELRESVLKLGDLAAGASGDEGAEIDSRLSLMSRGKGILGVTVIGPEDTYENRANPPTGFDQLVSAAWEAVAAVTGIPQIILMGSSPGGLNTDGASAWEGFRQLVSSWQESDLREELERYYGLVYAQRDGPTKGVEPDDWCLEFASLDEPDASTVAETRKIVAETDAIYIAAGVYSAADVAAGRFGASGYSFDLEEVDPNGVELPEPAAPTAAQPGDNPGQGATQGDEPPPADPGT